MTVQAYIDNVRAKTGKSPEELKTHARKAGSASARAARRLPSMP
jgi:hypothetical protein